MKLEVSCTSELWNTQELEERVLCLQQMPELVSVEKYSPEELNRIQAATERIREDSEVLIVIGTGADYEKAHRMMKFYGHHFYNVLPKEERKGPEIYFAGQNLDSTYLYELIEVLGGREFSINVISESGEMESAIVLRVFRALLEKKYGKFFSDDRIYTTVGIYAGLLPIALMGADLSNVAKGREEISREEVLRYVAMGEMLRQKGLIKSRKEVQMEVEHAKHDLFINEDPFDFDRLNYLAGKSLDSIRKMLAKESKEEPKTTLKIHIPSQDEYSLGQLMVFWELSRYSDLMR